MGTETNTENIELLYQCVQDETADLLSIIQAYVWKADLAKRPDQVEPIAMEVLNEVFIEAVEKASRFDSNRSPRAWLLGFAANIIQRRRRSRREVSVSDLRKQDEDASDFFDRLAAITSPQFEQDYDLRDQIEAVLPLLTGAEQEIVRATLTYGIDFIQIAQMLRIKPGTARVRWHRALAHLRALIKR